MEQENIILLDYFDKFQGYNKFEELKEKLDKYSKLKFLYDIQLGDLTLPYIGPDKELEKFPQLIEKEWGDKIASEIKYLLKYYDGGEIENIAEALIILEIKYHETKDEQYLALKDKLVNDEDISTEDVEFLTTKPDIMHNSLLFFFINV